MNNVLTQWVDTARIYLEAKKFVISFPAEESNRCVSVNLDSPKVVGTITHWPDHEFEFQFNDASTGNVLVLETTALTSTQQLDVYFKRLCEERLEEI